MLGKAPDHGHGLGELGAEDELFGLVRPVHIARPAYDRRDAGKLEAPGLRTIADGRLSLSARDQLGEGSQRIVFGQGERRVVDRRFEREGHVMAGQTSGLRDPLGL